MKIHEAKSSGYNSVNTESIVSYICGYASVINDAVFTNKDKLKEKDRTQLKAVVAELETVNKRLEYILNGRY